MSEAEVHHELYRHLQNEIETDGSYHGITYTETIPEYSTTTGFADLVLKSSDSAFLVIEAKRPGGGHIRDIDPYSVAVVRQAAEYALDIGAPYFATYNGNKCVLFKTLQPGTPLLDRDYKGFEVESPRELAPELLETVAKIHQGETKWPPAHEALIERLSTFHSRLASEFEHEFYQKVGGVSKSSRVCLW